MIISKNGIVDDGTPIKSIIWHNRGWTCAELAEHHNLSWQNMNRKINKYIRHESSFEDIFKPAQRCSTIVNGEEISYITLMDRYECKEHNARKRIQVYNKSKKSAKDYKRLTMQAITRTPSKKPVPVSSSTERELAALRKIPSAGTWEEANLKPGKYVNRESYHHNDRCF